MIYGFAKQSGGQVRIYSEIDQGTMVCLYLPRHLGEAEAEASLPDLAHAPPRRAGRDGPGGGRRAHRADAGDRGAGRPRYAAIEAADGASGLKVLQSDVRIDMLITDVGLPGGMNGRQMADAGRQHRADLKVLFITGYAENAALNHGHLGPGMQVMTKPFALEALATRIRGIIGGEG